ncbi:hypothetical protein [Candidatus Poriferisodalis sp.]|uniref:hypothetical protein n=1 Tax=Candidatus Poriferisodalis sp. TaxID=3101277 RepID=UPI003D0AEC44
MVSYNPNRPRPNMDAGASLPGDPPQLGGSALAHEAVARDPEPESDPATPPASHLLPRQAKPVDPQLLYALGGAMAFGGVLVAAMAWWLWRRWRRR